MNAHHARSDSGTFSARWFEMFLDRIPSETTAREIAFLTGVLPLPAHRRILDICCGPGRHAAALARLGHAMSGVDRDPSAIARARANDPSGEYHCADVREMPPSMQTFDASICMWASFGWFSDPENQRLLERMFQIVRPGGRVVLDVYNPAFFHNAKPVFERNIDGVQIIEHKRIEDHRLYVTLDYQDGGSDHFQWRIFTVDELAGLALACGGVLVHACAEFRIGQPPSDTIPRMQIVFEKAVP